MAKKEIEKNKVIAKKPVDKTAVANKKVVAKKPTTPKITAKVTTKTDTKTGTKVIPAKKEKKVETKKKEPSISKIVPKKDDRYFEAVGRRKTAVARVRLYNKGKKNFLVNGKNLNIYFPLFGQRKRCLAPVDKTKFLEKYEVEVIVKGGGLNAQADAICHGLARSLVLLEPELRKQLRQFGHLTRDPRKRERKKFGLKRARRAPQWRKR